MVTPASEPKTPSRSRQRRIRAAKTQKRYWLQLKGEDLSDDDKASPVKKPRSQENSEQTEVVSIIHGQGLKVEQSACEHKVLLNFIGGPDDATPRASVAKAVVANAAEDRATAEKANAEQAAAGVPESQKILAEKTTGEKVADGEMAAEKAALQKDDAEMVEREVQELMEESSSSGLAWTHEVEEMMASKVNERIAVYVEACIKVPALTGQLLTDKMADSKGLRPSEHMNIANTTDSMVLTKLKGRIQELKRLRNACQIGEVTSADALLQAFDDVDKDKELKLLSTHSESSRMFEMAPIAQRGMASASNKKARPHGRKQSARGGSSHSKREGLQKDCAGKHKTT